MWNGDELSRIVRAREWLKEYERVQGRYGCIAIEKTCGRSKWHCDGGG